MKEKTKELTDCGAIIGRMQCHQLHDAHKDLIQSVSNRHARVIIFLGISPIRNSKKNPLDFRHRKDMILEEFPNVEIYYLDDNRSDEKWSQQVDSQLRKWLVPGQTATIYGSRDSFMAHYVGKFPVCELVSEINISASQVRKAIINNYPSSKDFRAGVIAANGQRYPTAYQTVDIAILNEDKLLLAKKPGEEKWRFIGGFSDPDSDSLEDDARRETCEETGVEVDDITYIGSKRIDDWRYRGSTDCIKTVFFVAKYLFGKAEGADDIEFTKWVKFDKNNKLDKNDIMVEHHPLAEMLNNWVDKQSKKK